ncbi:MAG TPA: hypothetical protein PLD25_32345 [Chloroflexota bacterium]|nr:hypothetical protein [Chloroflexota bacterium]
MTNQPNLTRVRIYTHITQSRFLHVEDALSIGKVRLFGGNYRQGAGMTAYAHAYVDVADARVIFGALARGEERFSYKEYKGTPQHNPASSNGGTAVSRVLSIAIKGENVYVELKTGPGKLTGTGAITPHGPAKVEVNVGFKLYEARRMAASVLAYIQAWDVMRMMANRQMVSKPVPYTSATLSTSLLVAATSEAHGVQSEPANPENGMSKPPSAVTNGRPVTRKSPVPKTNGATVKQGSGQPARTSPAEKRQPAKPDTARAEYLDERFAEVTGATEQPLKYGDGHMVDGGNLTEVQTFQRYIVEKKAAPESKKVLLDYYRQAPANIVNS